jgi:hypothetical protein
MTYLNGIVHSHRKTDFFWQLEIFDVYTTGAHIELLYLSGKKTFNFPVAVKNSIMVGPLISLL